MAMILACLSFITVLLLFRGFAWAEAKPWREVGKHLVLLLFGLPCLFLIPFFAYEVWLATGLPPDFGAVYVMGGSSAVVTLFGIMSYFSGRRSYLRQKASSR
ncbi:hypothetical protein ACNA6I_12425 [Rossellomorea sp. FS2]|uniref:hypothetical protein n=1 Tax=Rossellomorea TaxID=2837508 RepID=UPI0020795764|nr:hypothetical protein [Rossellomorea marisflavi]USK93267.1 hypothetical protein LIT29_05825 [Rossellomorea marisflavi]